MGLDQIPLKSKELELALIKMADKKFKFTDINVPHMPESRLIPRTILPKNVDFKSSEGDGQVESPVPPTKEFNPIIQRNVEELQVGESETAVWITKKDGLLFPTVYLNFSTVLYPNEHYVFGDATSGAITFSLPIGQRGKEFVIKKTDNVNNITIDSDVSETIDGAASITLTVQYDAIRLIFDGFEWFIVGSY